MRREHSRHVAFYMTCVVNKKGPWDCLSGWEGKSSHSRAKALIPRTHPVADPLGELRSRVFLRLWARSEDLELKISDASGLHSLTPGRSPAWNRWTYIRQRRGSKTPPAGEFETTRELQATPLHRSRKRIQELQTRNSKRVKQAIRSDENNTVCQPFDPTAV